MADPRFFTRIGPFPLSEILKRTGAAYQPILPTPAAPEPISGPEPVFTDIAPLEVAGPGDVSFLDNVKYVDAFRATRAGACFVRAKFAADAPPGTLALVTDAPYTAYARAAGMFYPTAFEPFISPRACVHETAEIGAGCRIEAGAWIGAGVVVGEGCFIGANATVSHAVLGRRVIIHPGAHIGQDGFGFAASPTGILKVPQLGRVLIGDEVEIGAGACIDRGAGPDTVIGDFCKIDNLVQIGHNCVLGKGVMIAGQAGLAGSTRVGDYAQIGGQAGTSGHIALGAGAKLAAQAGVMRDIPPGEAWGGFPAKPIREWHRESTAVAKLGAQKRRD